MPRILLVLGSLLLLATAAIHAAGVGMVEGWSAGLPPRPAAALRLVWLSDSFDWAVTAAIWLLAAWRGVLRDPVSTGSTAPQDERRAWRAAAAIAALIPLAGAAGVLWLDWTFFGGWMLLASCALAGAGLAATPRL